MGRQLIYLFSSWKFFTETQTTHTKKKKKTKKHTLKYSDHFLVNK